MASSISSARYQLLLFPVGKTRTNHSSNLPARLSMEEQSEISMAATNFTKEMSDSSSSSYLIQNSKRPKMDPNSSSSKFKGVVLQQNGHWGAQIYANHQRIWLGTFKSEVESAMAYDSASIKLRSGDSHRNFPWTNITIQEPNFQSQFSTEIVLNMIKDGSYSSKFLDYLREVSKIGQDLVNPPKNGAFFCRKLFHKELTPSDVGKLNRLVIPKKFAVMYFPRIPESGEDNNSEENAAAGVDDTELVFFDRTMRSWKFRYCYWKSSQSFVFTRGWNRFVKDKGLRAKDMIIFSFCECKGGGNNEQMQSLFMIDVGYYEGVVHGGGLVQNENTAFVEENDSQETESNGSRKKGFRLFGVQII
ncbi:hypothetical protein M9H77_29830 [Catharanthus roseus]|uniref:Uncharacterized protein n=1 Tax=Catharanthus roseus TaxID=4058 RepID=A0ACB9ZZS2_CATRO|nr:hypothetical protein M9H77_29830 [Catharanthus roseus]